MGAVLLRFGLQFVDRLGVAVEQLVDRTFDHQVADVEDGDPIADPLDVVEDVRAHEDRGRAAEPAE